MLQRTIIIMLDGFGWDYWLHADMPHLKKMAAAGRVRQGLSVFPTLTNANNVSIACGCWPSQHGIGANCRYDPGSGAAGYVETSTLLRAPTVFDRAAARGVRSALLSCKRKTVGILGDRVELAVTIKGRNDLLAAGYREAPSAYSAEANFWLLEMAVAVLGRSREIGLLYLHTTDFPMHHWGPTDKESQTHLAGIDAYLEEISRIAPDAAVLVTADHGMNAKRRCLNLAKICAARGVPVRHALSPVANRMMAHCGGYGGVSYLYLQRAADRERIRNIVAATDGVEAVLDGGEAAGRFHLDPGSVGDLVVLADAVTVFGRAEEECQPLPADYRGHGSLHETAVPLIGYNLADDSLFPEEAERNFHLTAELYRSIGTSRRRLQPVG
ncbi:MAG: alkaline phosphatase family protein [Planctomycetes bacterium]|nr:alkaline phosphatase family protein [Planctomycetota bacterium]